MRVTKMMLGNPWESGRVFCGHSPLPAVPDYNYPVPIPDIQPAPVPQDWVKMNRSIIISLG